MSSTDWVTLAGVVVAVFALAVSFFTLRRQARKDKSDAEKDLAEQVKAIQAAMGELPTAGRPIDMYAKTSNVNGMLDCLALRAAALIGRERLQPDWFQTMVIAYAFAQVWDLAAAEPYMNRAVELARAQFDPTADGGALGHSCTPLALSLSTRASFHYARFQPGDLDRARGDLDEARSAIDRSRSHQGPNASASQIIELCMRQAQMELLSGETAKAVDVVAAALEEWRKLKAPAARQLTGSMLYEWLRKQHDVPIETFGLPQDFVDEMEAAELKYGATLMNATAPAARSGQTDDILGRLAPTGDLDASGSAAGPSAQVTETGSADRAPRPVAGGRGGWRRATGWRPR